MIGYCGKRNGGHDTCKRGGSYQWQRCDMGERNQYCDSDREQDRSSKYGIYRNGNEERTGLISVEGRAVRSAHSCDWRKVKWHLQRQ